jgi:polyhydroxybutyrate depolymerase
MFKSILRQTFCGINAKVGNAANITSIKLMRPEGLRHYLMAIPDNNSAGKRPLVIVLHGGGSTAEQVLGIAYPPSPLSIWLEIAEREQLVVAAPNGCKRWWKARVTDETSNSKVDDTGFINAIIDKAIAENDVDPSRVYVIGVSKGGMMAFRLAVKITHKLAAFAVILASMPAKGHGELPKLPLSGLIIAGTSDPFMPYAGGKSFYTRGIGSLMSVDESVSIWRELAGLTMPPTVSSIAHCNAGDRTRATRFLWGSDPRKLQLALVKIDNGGHMEPSQRNRYPWFLTRLVGAQNADFEVAEEAWQFFKDKRSGLVP